MSRTYRVTMQGYPILQAPTEQHADGGLHWSARSAAPPTLPPGFLGSDCDSEASTARK